MFVALSELCAKWYGLVFKSELSRPSHTTYHITVVITNIEKQKHRFAKKQGTPPDLPIALQHFVPSSQRKGRNHSPLPRRGWGRSCFLAKRCFC